MRDIPWGNPDSNILDDIAAAAERVKQDSETTPDTIYCNLKTYAYLILGHFIDDIADSIEAAKNYTLPRFTFRDHLKDCFGWLWLRPATKAKSWAEILFDDWIQKAGLL